MTDHRIQENGLPNEQALTSLKAVTDQIRAARMKLFEKVLFISFEPTPSTTESWVGTRLSNISEQLGTIERALIAIYNEYEVRSITTTSVVRK
jgi:hypothetical protein